jgi:CspA family cold shock protein
MASGTIKSMLYDKGFGFISPDDAPDGKSDIFFHQSSVADHSFDQLREGQRVTFTAEPDPRDSRRSRAANVEVAND